MKKCNFAAGGAAGVTAPPPRGEFSRILTNDDLIALSEDTMLSEADGVSWAIDDGTPDGGFWSLAEDVAKATKTAAADLCSWQAHVVFAMRAFYLLGVLRGGEAYRNLVTPFDEPEFREIPFTLDKNFSEDCVEDLNSISVEDLNGLLTMLGLSVPLAADKTKGKET